MAVSCHFKLWTDELLLRGSKVARVDEVG
jgi:hypothetical protein